MNGRGGGGGRFTAFQDPTIHTLNPYRLSPALKTTPSIAFKIIETQ